MCKQTMFNYKLKTMNFRINPMASDVIILLYVVVSLFYRIKFEYNSNVGPFQSIAIGASFALILWSFIKLKILNPNWFGLFASKKIKP